MPFSLAEVVHAQAEIPHGAQHQENPAVGCCVVDGRGDVAHPDPAGGAGGHVDLVVACAVVTDEF